jgi:hypothetical protein
MRFRPKPEDVSALCEVLVNHLDFGARSRPTFQYLFKIAIEDLNQAEPRHIGEREIADEIYKNPQAVDAARTLISRLKKALEMFFDEHPIGRKQQFRVDIERSSYALRFSRNVPPPWRRST